jgi:hypothetical protein
MVQYVAGDVDESYSDDEISDDEFESLNAQRKWQCCLAGKKCLLHSFMSPKGSLVCLEDLSKIPKCYDLLQVKRIKY